MKKLLAAVVIGTSFIAMPVMASNGLVMSELRDACLEQVSEVTLPHLDKARAYLDENKAKDGRTYWEVFHDYRTFRLSADAYAPVAELDRAIQTVATAAVTRCTIDLGGMDGLLSSSDKKTHPTAREILNTEFTPKVKQFHEVFENFIWNYYNPQLINHK